VQGIEKRTNKDGSSTYRARVRIKGHPYVRESFSSLTLAKKWKRDTESAIEQGRFQFSSQEKKHTFAELVDRYIQTILLTNRLIDHVTANLFSIGFKEHFSQHRSFVPCSIRLTIWIAGFPFLKRPFSCI
jgi:hypothetical protein